MLDRNETRSYYTVDNFGMMLPNKHTGDSILATFEAFIAYGEIEFVHAILDCYRFEKNKIKGWRHPGQVYGTQKPNLSRDHYIATLLAIWYSSKQGSSPELEMLVRNIDKRLSPGHRITWDLQLWSNALITKRFGLWRMLAIPYYLLMMLWNKVLQVLGGFYEEPNEVYAYEDPNWLQRTLRSLRFPSYAHYLASWQNFATPKGFGKRMLAWILRLDTGRWNPATCVMNGRSANFDYPAMLGGRLNSRTDKTNDRPHMKMDRSLIGKNQLDVDLVSRIRQIAYSN